MGNNTCYREKQWLPNQYDTELESKANKKGEKAKTKTQQQQQQTKIPKNKWIAFTYFSPWS
jgi:hypothetical protein